MPIVLVEVYHWWLPPSCPAMRDADNGAVWLALGHSCPGRILWGPASFHQKKPAPPLVNLLGWGCVRNDQAVIHALVEALLRGRMATMAWCSSKR